MAARALYSDRKLQVELPLGLGDTEKIIIWRFDDFIFGDRFYKGNEALYPCDTAYMKKIFFPFTSRDLKFDVGVITHYKNNGPETSPDKVRLLQEFYSRGCGIMGHSTDHRNYSEMRKSEIQRDIAKQKEAFSYMNIPLRGFIFPRLSFLPWQIDLIHSEGIPVVIPRKPLTTREKVLKKYVGMKYSDLYAYNRVKHSKGSSGEDKYNLSITSNFETEHSYHPPIVKTAEEMLAIRDLKADVIHIMDHIWLYQKDEYLKALEESVEELSKDYRFMSIFEFYDILPEK